MTVATRTAPDYTSQSGAQYRANIDAALSVDARIGGCFAPHEQNVGSPAPDLSMRVDAGFILDGITLTEIAAQTVSGFSTPTAGYQRIDRVVVDALTGVASRVAGIAETAGSPGPSAPAIPAGKLPICQILFTSSTTAITNSMITDERAPSSNVGAGTHATTFTFNGSGGSTGSLTLTWQKIGNWVTLNIPIASATTGTGSTVLRSNTALPSNLRPTAAQTAACNVMKSNGAATSTPGVLAVNTDGTVDIYQVAVTAFNNSAAGGTVSNTSITYFIG